MGSRASGGSNFRGGNRFFAVQNTFIMKLDYNVRVTFFPKPNRLAKQAFYRFHLQIDGRKILYKITFMDRSGRLLDIDTSTIYDGSRTYWGSHDGKTGLALQYPGLAIDQFFFEGVGLPFFGFDYPGIPFTKIRMAVPATPKSDPSYKKYLGQMVVGTDHSVDPPVVKYSDLVAIVKDRDDRIVQCGSLLNGVPVDLWTLSNYRKYPDIALPMHVRHQVGYISGVGSAPIRSSVSVQEVGNSKMPNVVVRNDYEAIFDFVSRG